MKIFLTGASGLVGGNVAQPAAAHGHEVIEASLISAFRAAAPDAIVNCAAISDPLNREEHEETRSEV